MPSLEDAKDRLDHIINIARVQWYKPIQIAEVLYKSRLGIPDLGGLHCGRKRDYRNCS